MQAAEPLETVANNYRPRQFHCRRNTFFISAQNPSRLGYKDERGMLFFEMVKILRERHPRFFIAENVKGLLSANKVQAFPMIMKEFTDAGYKVIYKLLNASDYGVPQKRERVFCLSSTCSMSLKVSPQIQPLYARTFHNMVVMVRYYRNYDIWINITLAITSLYSIASWAVGL